eukprot:TRINITY_DN2254_c0_g1_i1.p1 TRINITY_DN2254_c0_g1~~TRINITY_DN2254_c0_g1_i1.p1  ORF type:complete len:737 (-),score=148.41 TRINITY_DN2254_c0_g1_i1:112-2322(-)
MSRALYASALLLGLILSVAAVPIDVQKVHNVAGAEILWDKFGIPHIYADDMNTLHYAYGWAQAHSHGDLILELVMEARGEAAKYFGMARIRSDRTILSFGLPTLVEKKYPTMDPTYRQYFEDFAAGFTAYFAKYPDRAGPRVAPILPVTGLDMAKHGIRVLYYFSVGLNAETASLSWKAPNATRDSINFDLMNGKIPEWAKPGSNAWAISPRRTASGNAMLVANPHLPYGRYFLWYEAHLVAPGVDITGAGLVGTPMIQIGINDFLSWTHTVNTINIWTSYELTVLGNTYLYDGRYRQFVTRTHTITILQDDGSYTQEEFIYKESVHGPVLAEKPLRAFAIRVPGFETSWIDVTKQWWEMGLAKNLAEFKTACRALQLPFFTIIYADAVGNIMHSFNGLVPIRTFGDYSYWTQIQDGTTSRTWWPDAYHPWDELPYFENPPSGWLQNANEPPWTTTFPLYYVDPAKYPAYVAPNPRMSHRSQTSARILETNTGVTFDKFVEMKHNQDVEMTRHMLDDLINALRNNNTNPRYAEAARVLSAWDRRVDVDSRGAVLFNSWVNKADSYIGSMYGVAWNPSDPLNTPNTLVNVDRAVSIMDEAIAQLDKRGFPLDIAWGEVNRLPYDGRFPNGTLPGNGAADPLGVFRASYFVIPLNPDTDDGFNLSGGGDSYVHVVEFSRPLKSKGLIGYGNASQTYSKHRNDQNIFYSANQLREQYRDRAELERNLEFSEYVSPSASH